MDDARTQQRTEKTHFEQQIINGLRVVRTKLSGEQSNLGATYRMASHQMALQLRKY